MTSTAPRDSRRASAVRDALRLALADRYVIERELGRGGMATVYLARDLRHYRFVALKVLRPELAASLSAERFLREIRFAAGLTHPHILPVHDSGSVGDDLYYVMPFVDGESLRDRLRRETRLSDGEAIRIAREVADALDYAHRNGVVHRDIKPENILLADGHAVVADFGIARAVNDGNGGGSADELTMLGVAIGTPAYMSPEQAGGEQTIDGRSDVYALACVLHEMLVGTPPFTGDTVRAIIARHFMTPAAGVRASRPDVSTSVEATILKALAKSPDDRIATARAFAESLAESTPSLRAAAAPSRAPLPIFAGALIGRDGELESIAALISSRPLVTILGPGGAGKSRIAVETAARAGPRMSSPVVYVPLAGLASADLLASTIADALGAVLEPQRDAGSQVVDYLQSRDMMLVLDNFESVVEAAPLLGQIAGAAPRVTMLVTSRERLGLSHETVFELGGLAHSDSGTGPAVELFAERAAQSDISFRLDDHTRALATRVCALVGGLPLGVELAASMLRVLAPDELAAELDRTLDAVVTPLRDVPARHRSLYALFESSWTRLTAEERTAVTRLSVLLGSFRRDAAEAVAGASLPMLLALVDKSLIFRPAPGRYAIHEVIRRCAEGKLAQIPGALQEAEEARCSFFTRFLGERAASLRGGAQRQSLTEISAELDNIRAAWQWAARNQDIARLSEALGPLARYYHMRRRSAEGAQVFDVELGPHAGSLVDGRIRAARAACIGSQGRVDEARRSFREAHRILHAHGATGEMMALLRNLGAMRFYTGRTEAARSLLRRAVATTRRLALHDELPSMLNTYGVLLLAEGAYPEAERLWAESMSLRRAVGDRWGMGNSLTNLCVLAVKQGRFAEARKYALEACEVAMELDDKPSLASAMANLADIQVQEGDVAAASATAMEALAYFSEIGNATGSAACMDTLGDVARRRADGKEARRWFRSALDTAASASAGAQLLATVWSVGLLLESEGRVDDARSLFAIVSAHPAAHDDVRERARQRLAGSAAPSAAVASFLDPTRLASFTRDLL